MEQDIANNTIMRNTAIGNRTKCYIRLDNVIRYSISGGYRIIHCSTQSTISSVFNSKDYLSVPDDLRPSVRINDSFSSSLLPVGPLSLAPHYSCLSTAWWSHMGPKCWLHLQTSSSLTTFDLLQKRMSPWTEISLLFDGQAPGPVDTGIKRDNEGTDWEAPLENNTSCCWMDIQYWQITIYVLPEWLPSHVENFHSDKVLE